MDRNGDSEMDSNPSLTADGTPETSRPSDFRGRVQAALESTWFTVALTTVIALNAVTLGLETWPAAVDRFGAYLYAFDRVALWIYTIELSVKFWVYRRRFFSSGWNVFDLIIVVIAWLPTAGPLSVLRAMRILRVLRLISIVPQMRTVIGALFSALPGMGSIVAVLLLVFYIAAVMTTKLFGEAFPHWFGTVGESMYSLFQIMTLESWSMGIVRPVMEEFPLAWIFFVPFVVVTSFAVLNLFIALIVNSMQSIHAEDREVVKDFEELAHSEREVLHDDIRALREEVASLRKTLQSENPRRG